MKLRWFLPVISAAVAYAAQPPLLLRSSEDVSAANLNRVLLDVYARLDRGGADRTTAQWPTTVDYLTVLRQLKSEGDASARQLVVGSVFGYGGDCRFSVRGNSIFGGRVGINSYPEEGWWMSVKGYQGLSRMFDGGILCENTYDSGNMGQAMKISWKSFGPAVEIKNETGFPHTYDLSCSAKGLRSGVVYTTHVAIPHFYPDAYIRISTCVAIAPHQTYSPGGKTIGLLDLRANAKTTALYIEGSAVGISIASGRSIGIHDSATYSVHEGYLLVSSSISVPLVGSHTSTTTCTVQGSSITLRGGPSHYVGVSANGIVLSHAATASNHAVRADRTITGVAGCKGGGNLTANRTIMINVATPFVGTMSWSGQHVFTQPVTIASSLTVTQEASADVLRVGAGSGSWYPYIYRDSDGGLMLRFDSNDRTKVTTGGNVHLINPTGSIGYWIDASTSYRWGMYRTLSGELAFRSNSPVDTVVIGNDGGVSVVGALVSSGNAKVHVTVSTSNVWTSGLWTVWYSNKVYDVTGAYSTTTCVFVAPRDGVYSVNAYIVVASSWVPTSTGKLYIYRNSSYVRTHAFLVPVANIAYSVGIGGDVWLDAGDEMTIRLSPPLSTTLTSAADPTGGYCTIHYVP